MKGKRQRRFRRDAPRPASSPTRSRSQAPVCRRMAGAARLVCATRCLVARTAPLDVASGPRSRGNRTSRKQAIRARRQQDAKGSFQKSHQQAATTLLKTENSPGNRTKADHRTLVSVCVTVQASTAYEKSHVNEIKQYSAVTTPVPNPHIYDVLHP